MMAVLCGCILYALIRVLVLEWGGYEATATGLILLQDRGV